MSSSSLIDSTATVSKAENLRVSNDYLEACHLKHLMGNCTTLEVSENQMNLTEMIQIAQLLRKDDKLQKLNICNNTEKIFIEVEFIIDVILSVNSKISELVVNGTSMKPRRTSYSKIIANNTEETFSLQHLYIADRFPLYLSQMYMFKENFVTCLDGDKKLVKVEEKCPFNHATVFSHYVDHKGGVYYYKDHDVALFIPPGAILQDDCVEIKVSSSFYGPFSIPQNYDRISSYVWVSAKYHFGVPVYLIINHFVDTKSVTNFKTLSAFEACELLNINRDYDKTPMMQEIATSYFDTNLRYCVISTNHFCTYCLAELQRLPTQGNSNNCKSFKSFLATYYTYEEAESNKGITYIAELCCLYFNNNCLKVQYMKCMKLNHVAMYVHVVKVQ